MNELRTLLPKEQEIVRKLVELKGDGKNINLQNYQAGKVLEEIVGFNFAAIKWDVNKQEPIYIYYEKNEEKDEALSSYFTLCDFLYLLEDLERSGLIAMQSVSSNEERLLYNRRKHKKEEFDNWEFKQEPVGITYLASNRGIHTYKLDIVDYLEHFIHLKIIYPRPALFEYVENGFKTIEQKRHDEEMDSLKNQLIITRLSAVLAFATLFVTAFLGIWQQCSSTRIESHDLESIAKSIQHMNYTQLPDNINHISDSIMAIDTLSTDSCNNTTPSMINSPVSTKQSKLAAVDLHNDTSCIVTTASTTDTVLIQSKKQ